MIPTTPASADTPPDALKALPREPTPAMIEAGSGDFVWSQQGRPVGERLASAYRAMWAATPTIEAMPEGGEGEALLDAYDAACRKVEYSNPKWASHQATWDARCAARAKLLAALRPRPAAPVVADVCDHAEETVPGVCARCGHIAQQPASVDLDVTQEDRDAAAHMLRHAPRSHDLAGIREGKYDSGEYVQAFRSHRLRYQHPRPSGEREKAMREAAK